MFRSLCLFATLFAVTFVFAQQKPAAAKPAAGSFERGIAV